MTDELTALTSRILSDQATMGDIAEIERLWGIAHCDPNDDMVRMLPLKTGAMVLVAQGEIDLLREQCERLRDEIKRFTGELAIERGQVKAIAAARDRFAETNRGLRVILETHEELKIAMQEKISVSRALLRGVIPKCEECGAIATSFYNGGDYDYFVCAEHRHDDDTDYVDYDLGRRTIAALEVE